MQPVGPGSEAVDARALAGALQAALAVSTPAEACRAILREVQAAVPFAFGVVLRLEDDRATVAGLYPGPMAGIELGVSWTPLDGAERALARFGEPSLDGTLRNEPGDRSPLVRLPAYGLRSALRVPLFTEGRVAGCVAIYAYEPGAFTARDGIAFEQYVRALAARLTTSAAAEVVPPVAAAEPPAAPPEVATPPARSAEPLSALSDVVSGVAHELNNPLTTILGYAQLLPTLEGDVAQRAMATIEREAQRAGRIVRNLLYFARQHQPRTETIDLNALLQRVIEVRRYSLPTSIRLDVRLGAVAALQGDPYQLEQVFLNLLTNAQQAMPDGGVITVETGTEGGAARVTVTDTGPGIPEALLTRVFEPFFTTRGVGEGSGMGLSIAYGIAQAHGGSLVAERPEQGGARFVVTLPLSGAVGAAGTSSAASTPPARVLVIDNRSEVRDLVTEMLAGAGYDVHGVAAATDALRVLAAGATDLVVTSAGMAGVGAESLAAQVVTRWPPLRGRMLLLRGEANGEPQPWQAGIATLEEPFTAQDLRTAARVVLGSAAGSA